MRNFSGLFAVFIAVLLAAYPLLRGGLDIWAQTLIQAELLCGFCLWAAFRAARRDCVAFKGVDWVPLVCAGGWLLSWALSPAPGFCREAALNWLTGAAVFYAAAWLPVKERNKVFKAVLTATWFMAAVALYQLAHRQDMTASFGNRNVFACWLLMLAPVLFARGKWFQALLFVVLIAFARSRAALLALALVFIFDRAFPAPDSRRSGFAGKIIAVVGAVIVAIAIGRMELFSLVQRLGWWRAAVEMIHARPLTGFGPGAYGYVYPAFHTPGIGQFSSTWAHCYQLQLAAETGLIFAALWLGWIVWRIVAPRKPQPFSAFNYSGLRGGERGALAAALLMSLTDYALASPPNFLLFCWLLGCISPAHEIESENEPVNGTIPVARIAVCLAFGLCAATLAAFAATRQQDIDSRLLRAKAALEVGGFGEGISTLKKVCAIYPQDPSASLMLARAYETVAKSRRDKALLVEAAAAYENALRQNPFNPNGYDALAGIYSMMGEKELASDVYMRKASWIKWWRIRH